MAELRISEVFARSANQLPKDAKAKLLKVFMLLTHDPRHPSLQLKKIKGAARPDVYECRVDQFWRLIVQDRGGMLFQLVDVGPHDETISRGGRVREEQASYQAEADSDEVVMAFLAGQDAALTFQEWSTEDAENAWGGGVEEG